ncbi:hypothetical protein [Mycolicibacterium sp. CR10]|uniref:hypothetical protein n=1 Tax=Mycolicibacterium sp. CR10 TaxID=2562314 RepID=UPI0010BF820D|nr:hypothetical protein [Mycolicibacterium sp. CR10]
MTTFTATLATTVSATIATALAGAFLGLAAPAMAAPTATGNADITISALEAQGNRVVVHRLSSTPLEDANVVSVRTGPEVQQQVIVEGRQGNDRQHRDQVLQTTGRVVFVDIA